VIIWQHKLASQKQKELHTKVLQLSDLNPPSHLTQEQWQELPLERKAKKVMIDAYIMRQRKESYLRFMKWYKAKEAYNLLLHPNYKASNEKLTEYDEKIPVYEELVKYLDGFLNKGVTNDLVTWSDKAKKERKREFQRRKSKEKNTQKDDQEAQE
jgi:hypothetical protein